MRRMISPEELGGLKPSSKLYQQRITLSASSAFSAGQKVNAELSILTHKPIKNLNELKTFIGGKIIPAQIYFTKDGMLTSPILDNADFSQMNSVRVSDGNIVACVTAYSRPYQDLSRSFDLFESNESTDLIEVGA